MVEAMIKQGHIKFEDVSFRYDTLEKNILSNVDVEIQPGQTVVLSGGQDRGKAHWRIC
jgi:ABC-type bacteriocin/lantibiotic exporter with double-glycine peptidase domain